MTDERPICVDAFCGRGGWARGFLDAGYRVVGVDLEDFSDVYPGEFVRADIRSIHLTGWAGKVRALVASPPCQSFSTANSKTRSPENGLVLVREAVRLVTECRPTWWALENVRGAVRYISAELGSEPSLKSRPWYVWGRFPPFLLPRSDRFYKGTIKPEKVYTVKTGPSTGRTMKVRRYGWTRADLAATVPYEIARGLAEACL